MPVPHFSRGPLRPAAKHGSRKRDPSSLLLRLLASPVSASSLFIPVEKRRKSLHLLHLSSTNECYTYQECGRYSLHLSHTVQNLFMPSVNFLSFLNTRSPERGALGAESVLCSHTRFPSGFTTNLSVQFSSLFIPVEKRRKSLHLLHLSSTNECYTYQECGRYSLHLSHTVQNLFMPSVNFLSFLILK